MSCDEMVIKFIKGCVPLNTVCRGQLLQRGPSSYLPLPERGQSNPPGEYGHPQCCRKSMVVSVCFFSCEHTVHVFSLNLLRMDKGYCSRTRAVSLTSGVSNIFRVYYIHAINDIN